MDQEKTLVVILCMHRCGSSLTARLLQRLGMSLGPFGLGEANESNRYGHFEAQPFVLLNREFQMRQFGFEGDLPDDADAFGRYCQCDGRWSGEETISEDAIHRGRELVTTLMQSGDVCGFKDPRTVQVWPYWRRVFAGMPGLRVVPLFQIRGPHEIAMSIFRRSQGQRDYAQALEVTAVHFRRMREIRDQWSGPTASRPSVTVQFDPRVCGLQLQQAAELIGLTWSDAAFAESYDASCRHNEPAVVEHPAQAAFEDLRMIEARSASEFVQDQTSLALRASMENCTRLLADSAEREATLQQHREFHRNQRDAARHEIAVLRDHIDVLEQDSAALRLIVARIPPLENRLAQARYELDMIRGSRTWRMREALANAISGRKTHAND